MSGTRDFLDSFAKELAERGYTTSQKPLTEVKESVETMDYKQKLKQFYCRHAFQPITIPYGPVTLRYKVCKSCGLTR